VALLEIHLNPSQRELKWFGLLVLLFFALIGGLVYVTGHSTTAATVLWALGVLLFVVYYAVPPLRVPLFVAWMYAAFPVGWTVSHLMLAIAYYLVITPIGLGMRLLGRDSMQRKFDKAARSYWQEHRTPTHVTRYFRQF
jgi:hypothetical protein